MTIDRSGNDRRAAAVALLAVLAVLALVAAGCGGSSSDTKANEAYANSVCGAIGTWEQQIKSIATGFSGEHLQGFAAVEGRAGRNRHQDARDAGQGRSPSQHLGRAGGEGAGRSALEPGDEHGEHRANRRRIHPGQRVAHDRRRGAGTARAAGQGPREHGADHGNVAADREGLARLGVQERRLVQEPRRVARGRSDVSADRRR